MNLETQFLAYIRQQGLFTQHDLLLVAVSGGLDSVVLCHLCHRAGFRFEIAHCNFKLRGEDSDRDEAFVAALALQYKVPYHVNSFDTTCVSRGWKKSIEETARVLRYEWFNSLLKTKASDGETGPRWLLTAHHADDNIETVAMHFFRGTGITGLRGMLPKNGTVVRPLLFARRSELAAYATTHNLTHVTDASNADNIYTRNFFRNQVLPLVQQQYPGADKNLLANITRFSDAALLYQEAVDLHVKKIVEYRGEELHLPVRKLLKIPALHTILYEVLAPYGFTSHQTPEAVALLNSDSGKYLLSPSHRLLKNRNWLILAPLQTGEAEHVLIEKGNAATRFSEGLLHLEEKAFTVISIDKNPLSAQLDAASIQFPLLLRKWKQGDYFYPLGMQKKKKLSRFFVDQKLSLQQKERTWVLEMNKKIIWVVGHRIDDRFKIIPSTRQVLCIDYRPNRGLNN